MARAGRPLEYEWYPIALRVRSPRILIPLKSEDQDAVLDLQAVLSLAYDEGRFLDRIDYSKPPFGRMSHENLNWCDEVLQSKGLRRSYSSVS